MQAQRRSTFLSERRCGFAPTTNLWQLNAVETQRVGQINGVYAHG